MPAKLEQSIAPEGATKPPRPSDAQVEALPERLVPPGNRLRPRGLLLLALGLLVLLWLMASDRHFAFSVPLGAVAALLAALGVLETLGTFDDTGPVAAVRDIVLPNPDLRPG